MIHTHKRQYKILQLQDIPNWRKVVLIASVQVNSKNLSGVLYGVMVTQIQECFSDLGSDTKEVYYDNFKRQIFILWVQISRIDLFRLVR